MSNVRKEKKDRNRTLMRKVVAESQKRHGHLPHTLLQHGSACGTSGAGIGVQASSPSIPTGGKLKLGFPAHPQAEKVQKLVESYFAVARTNFLVTYPDQWSVMSLESCVESFQDHRPIDTNHNIGHTAEVDNQRKGDKRSKRIYRVMGWPAFHRFVASTNRKGTSAPHQQCCVKAYGGGI